MTSRLPRRAASCLAALAVISLDLRPSCADADPFSPTGRSPRVNYALHCQGCHLPDGSGSPAKVPDMRREISDLLTIPGGREYLVQVPGAATSRLDNRDLAELLNWLVKQMGVPPSRAFMPYTEAEVARLRPHWLPDPKQERTRLLEQIQARRAAPPATR